MSAAPKPKWLILGGLGFIGRNLCKYLVDNGLASYIRIADKKAPFMAFLSGDYKAAILESGLVECVQVDIADEEMCEKAFAEAKGGGAFDYVVNLAAETAYGKAESFYAKTVDGAALAGKFALLTGVKRFVHVSTASVYKPAASSTGTAEDGKMAPWTTVAESMLKSEAVLQGMADLPLVILRPALVYGPGDFASLMSRCVVAASYKVRGDARYSFVLTV
jgi:nucleoside-diphosphate-sugar epimerase